MQQVQVMESSKARLDADAVKLEHDLDERIERNSKANEDMCATSRPAPLRPDPAPTPSSSHYSKYSNT